MQNKNEEVNTLSDSSESNTKNFFKIENNVIKVTEIPNRSHFQLCKMGMVYFGVEVLFSIELALTVPILLKLKVSESTYSFVYFLSPLLGCLFQPILGLMSDKCESSFGRRRPFILALAIFAFIGISLILNGSLIGEWFGDRGSEFPIIGIVLVGIGVTLLDFSADSCDSPLRAFLLDVCNPKDADTGLNIHAFLGGVGASLGYILTAIEWEKSFLFNYLDENQILFFISTVLFLISLLLTLTSAKEKRYIPQKDELNGNENETTNLKELLSNMPIELKRLLIAQLLGWLALFANTLFFTDFIGQSIYKGNPASPEKTIEFDLYNYGTKMGSWCLFSFSISSAISAILFEKILMEKYSTKTLYLSTYFLYVFSCVVIYFLDNVYQIIPFCFSFGILMTALTTLPYQMLAEFHKDEFYVNFCRSGVKRGLGFDCALLCSCFFLAQTIVSLFMSLLTANFGNRVILVVGGFFGLIGLFYILIYVIFPKNNAATRYKEN